MRQLVTMSARMFFDESVASWITASDYADETSARAALDKQDIGVAIIVPQNFTEHFLSGDKDVQVIGYQRPNIINWSRCGAEYGHDDVGWRGWRRIAFETIIEAASKRTAFSH